MPVQERVAPTEGGAATSPSLGSCSLSRASVDAARKLLYGVGMAVEELESGADASSTVMHLPPRFACPNHLPDIEESLRTFVPTAVLFRGARWADTPILLADVDQVDNPKFLTSVYAADRVRDVDGERHKRIVAQSLLLPPALRSEAERRSELVQRSGQGVSLAEGQPMSLTRQLEQSEIRMLRRMSLESQLAVVTLLASRGGPVAFVSQRGSWPTGRLITRLGVRLDCRIYRFSIATIPRLLWLSMCKARYRPA